jgi:endonuclease/exonuclease/phosphatase family metal-dependent hydrolase
MQNDAVRVLTFNVRYDADYDEDEQAWENRKELVASTIRFHRPDIVGLQEPLDHQLNYIGDETPDLEWVGVGRADGESAGEYSPIGFRADRFDLVDTGTFWLSETPSTPGNKDWGAFRPRIVTWAALRPSGSSPRFFHFNTHFDHDSERARVESARLLRDKVSEVVETAPGVVTGDLNCEESAEPYKILTEDSLVDAFYASKHPHHGPTVTFERFDGPPDRKIDYILATDDLNVVQHGTLCDRNDDGIPSDHLPLVADIELPNE